MKHSPSLRLVSASLLLLALGACGGGDDGADLVAPRNDLSAADIDAALGPADQTAIRDAGVEEPAINQALDNGVESNRLGSDADQNREVQE